MESIIVESLLPPSILRKATLLGHEYAWRLADVPDVLASARAARLATTGGRVQFRISSGTCELYWRNAIAGDQRLGAEWSDYVARSADEVLTGFRRFTEAELIEEGLQWPEIAEDHSAGSAVKDYLCFVLFFMPQHRTEPKT